jgi:esterase/lipase
MARKVPLSLRTIQIAFGFTEAVYPKYAYKWAVKLFLSPIRLPYTEKGNRFLNQVESFKFRAGEHEVVGYRRGSGPEVICVHGWAGKASQFAAISEAIVNAGFTFISFDAWGHGQSEGKQSSLLDFAAAVQSLLKMFPNTKAIIGHSLGAATIPVVASEGIAIPKFVCLGAPSIGEDILETFRQTINGSPKIKDAIRVASIEQYGRAFDSFSMSETFHTVKSQVLAIHGEEDIDVGIFHLDRLIEIKPEMEVMRVPKLGHRRILKDANVITRVVAFIGE